MLDPSPQGTGFVVHPGNNESYDIAFQSSINGTAFAGQNVQLTLDFNGFFIRAFTQTERGRNPLGVDLFLPYLPFWPGVTPPPDSPTVNGTATFLDALGQPLGSAMPVNFALDGGPGFQADVQLFFFTQQFPSVPIDIYGVQYDLQLSNSPGKTFANAPRPDFLSLFGLFGVGPGPGVPVDIVPDAGSTLGLLLCGIATFGVVYCAEHLISAPRFKRRLRKL